MGIRIMDIKTNRDLIAPPPQTEMFVGTGLTKKMSVAFMDLHAEHAAMQLKAFTKWWDSWLKPRGTEVTDLCEQIKDGVIAIKLIEALSGCKAASTHELKYIAPSSAASVCRLTSIVSTDTHRPV